VGVFTLRILTYLFWELEVSSKELVKQKQYNSYLIYILLVSISTISQGYLLIQKAH